MRNNLRYEKKKKNKRKATILCSHMFSWLSGFPTVTLGALVVM